MEIKPIATIKTDFTDKFGIPRQSGRIEQLIGTIVFEKEFADKKIRTTIQSKNFSTFEITHYSLYLYGICNKCKSIKTKSKARI